MEQSGWEMWSFWDSKILCWPHILHWPTITAELVLWCKTSPFVFCFILCLYNFTVHNHTSVRAGNSYSTCVILWALILSWCYTELAQYWQIWCTKGSQCIFWDGFKSQLTISKFKQVTNQRGLFTTMWKKYFLIYICFKTKSGPFSVQRCTFVQTHFREWSDITEIQWTTRLIFLFFWLIEIPKLLLTRGSLCQFLCRMIPLFTRLCGCVSS